MDVGIAFDLRSDFRLEPGAPVDRLEEYDSEATVQAIARAIEANGHRARLMGGRRRFVEAALASPPDIVFNIAEGWGTRSREAHVPAACEMLGIPFTHGDPLALALTLDKPLAKRVVASHGVPTAPFAVVERVADVRAVELPFPLFAKPAAEGSSMGVRRSSRCSTPAELAREVERLLADYRQPVLVETYLPGVELTVGVIGNDPPRILGVMEIAPKRARREEFVYGLETKRDWEVEVDYHVPPRSLDALKLRQVEEVALAAYRALGCRDVARLDIRLDARGMPCFMEVNPLPGLSPVSGDIVIMARATGLSYEGLIGAILDAALARTGLRGAPAGRLVGVS